MPHISDVVILLLLLSMGPAQAPNAVTRETTTVATVDRIERSSRVLTAHSRGQTDNQRGVHPVQNKELLEGLRRGDRIEITLTLARAVSIEPER